MKTSKQEPCEDAISRTEVIKSIDEREDVNGKVDAESVRTDIVLMQPVNPQPKTGYWIYDNFNWRCSECNETPKTMGYVGTADFMTEHFKFCNHCGARMIEPQEISEVQE